MNTTLRVRRHTSVRLSIAALVAVLLVGLLPAAAMAQSADPCLGSTPATHFADYAQIRQAHRGSVDCGYYRDVWPGTSTDANGAVRYRPLDEVTRAEIAAFVVDALVAAGYDDALPAATSTDKFSDIAQSPHRVAINRLALAGLIRGVSSGVFAPDLDVSRQQLASFLVQAANFVADPDLSGDGRDRFTDVAASNLHKANIETGADEGLFSGTSATTFRPGRTELRDAMASFAVNLLKTTFDATKAPAPFSAILSVTDSSVEAGDTVSGTINGSNLAGASASGCGTSSQDLSDGNALLSGIQFSVRIPSSTAVGDCLLRFTFEFANGATQLGSRTIDVELPTPGTGGATRGASVQPELTTAKVTGVSAGGANWGTTVRYTFDENVELATDPTLFYVYDRDGVPHVGSSFVGTTATDKNTTIDVLFDGGAGAPDTQAAADRLTVATVDFGAAQDVANDESPEGDAALGTLTNSTTSLKGGTTSAPDLLRADVRNEIGVDDRVYEVDFIFDETVSTASLILGDFLLVLENGTVLTCVATDSTPASTTVDTECGTAAVGPQWVPTDASRGIVLAGVVADSAPNFNVLQAGEAEGDDGNTDVPDLVSAKFYPGAKETDDDKVAFTFDEDIDDTLFNCAQFSLYTSTMGTELPTGGCVWDSDRIIVATFDADALDSAVGAVVIGGGVQEDSLAGRANLIDEVGVTNTSTNSGAGFTSGPDLTSVNVKRERSVLGTVKGIIATYTFDEDVEAGIFVTDFYLYDANGERYQATACAPKDAGDDPSVECTGFSKAGIPLTLNGEVDLYNKASVGTVDDAAALDDLGDANPEGASRATAS